MSRASFATSALTHLQTLHLWGRHSSVHRRRNAAGSGRTCPLYVEYIESRVQWYMCCCLTNLVPSRAGQYLPKSGYPQYVNCISWYDNMKPIYLHYSTTDITNALTGYIKTAFFANATATTRGCASTWKQMLQWPSSRMLSTGHFHFG